LTLATRAEAACILWDRSQFLQNFNREPFFVEHRLSGHPLFNLARLVELARALPQDRVEYNAGDLPLTLDPAKTPRNGLSVEETIRRIEECRSWMVLKNVEVDPDYRRLLDECLDPLLEWRPDIRTREAFVFISSPGAVTPYHIDPECNFLLQIRGEKTVRMFPPDDRTILTEEELERFYAGGSRNLLRLDDVMESKSRQFELTPGRGLHFPVAAPHWVRNGPEVSVSFSVTFRTEDSDRREILYRVNHRLRRLGLRPRPVGASRAVDDWKYSLFRAARRVARTVRGARRDPAPSPAGY
jgi:hypothetical protein